MGEDVTVGNFGGEPYRELGEMLLELTAVVRKYNGRVPLAGAIGVLNLVQDELIKQATG